MTSETGHPFCIRCKGETPLQDVVDKDSLCDDCFLEFMDYVAKSVVYEGMGDE